MIHSIRHDSKVRDNIKIVLKELLENGADASIQDSEGKDALVHAVIRNHTNTFHYILNLLEDSEEEEEKKDTRQSVRGGGGARGGRRDHYHDEDEEREEELK